MIFMINFLSKSRMYVVIPIYNIFENFTKISKILKNFFIFLIEFNKYKYIMALMIIF